ncbi:hypothetical protein [Aeromicrobium sp.]|uniref:hypothetical protein n=1 Tax=Aeromicrobium sp. TaxID=1871063 RepID=UPI0030BDBBC3
MTRRLLGIAAFLVALGGAVWAGTIVRDQLEGPGPVETVRIATTAYARGDCEGLRAVSARPKAVECSAVRDVQRAYRDEGLKPAEFTFDLATQDGSTAMVRISYVSGGQPLSELVPVEKDGGDWRISEVSR